MSDQTEGYVAVTRRPLQGMVSLRADLADATVARAVKQVTGLTVPDMRRIVSGPRGDLAWMSPDELLFLCDHAEAGDVAAALSERLAGLHHLVVDVSDARAVFTLSGRRWREVLAKLTPADLSPGTFATGELRRSRLAQAAAAFWISGPDEVTVICFASVADYVQTLLHNAARKGSEVGLF